MYGLGLRKGGLVKIDETKLRATSEVTYLIIALILFVKYCWLTISTLRFLCVQNLSYLVYNEGNTEFTSKW